MDVIFTPLIMLAIVVVVIVAISRWVFRVNDVVKRLDKIVALMEKETK